MFVQLKWRLVAICVLFMAAAPMVQAQEVASSFDQLRVLLKRGDTVTVTDASGREITGKIADLALSSLTLLVGGRRSNLGEGDVRTISQQRHGDLATGAKWGFGIGAGFGLALAYGVGENKSAYAGLAAVWGGLGAGIGVGISASMSSQHVIYAKPDTASTKLTASPLLTRDRQGMVLSLGF